MNLLVLTSVYPQPDDRNVVTPTVQYFCRKWAEAGHRVMVIHSNSCFPKPCYWVSEKLADTLSAKMGFIFPNKESRSPLHRMDAGVRVYRLPMKKRIPHGRFSNRALDQQVCRIEAILKEQSFVPDLMISHWLNPQVDLVRLLRKKYTAKTSIVFHNDCSQETIKQFSLSDIHQVFDAVGCRNQADADKTKALLSLPYDPFLCYSGIPDEYAAMQQSVLSGEKPLACNREFIYVGRLVTYKNVDTILKALAMAFPEKDFTLHVVGVGAELDALKNLAQSLDITPNVIFHGAMPREQVFDLMRRCFCFTMVSNHETFGMVYMEALLAGCVTIASQKGGVDGVIRHGENGCLSPQGDPEALAKLYTQIVREEPATIRELRVHAIQTAMQYKDSAVAERYLQDVLARCGEEKS